MYYTIGQVSQMFDLPISTLRYYDKLDIMIKKDSFLILYVKEIFATLVIMN